MSFEPLTIIRFGGIAGILGALIVAAGDLLYHHIPGSKQSLPERMSSLPQPRQVMAGMLGLIGSWFFSLAPFICIMPFCPLEAFLRSFWRLHLRWWRPPTGRVMPRFMRFGAAQKLPAIIGWILILRAGWVRHFTRGWCL